MLIRIHLITTLVTLFYFDFNKCSNSTNQQRITVIGKAIEIKHHAFVRTKDSGLYYLDDKDEWDDKYLGKKVNVTGYLVIKKYEYERDDSPPRNDSLVNVIPQRRVGTWKIIEKPKWKLVK